MRSNEAYDTRITDQFLCQLAAFQRSLKPNFKEIFQREKNPPWFEYQYPGCLSVHFRNLQSLEFGKVGMEPWPWVGVIIIVGVITSTKLYGISFLKKMT